MGHGPGWYAYMQGQLDAEQRKKEYEQKQRFYAEKRAEREEWKLEHMSSKKCPKCGGIMYKREGKYGEFLGCENYPDCRGTRKL